MKNSVYGNKTPIEYHVNQRFCCSRFRTYRPFKKLLANDNLRQQSYHNDRTNQRDEGRELC